MNDTTFFFDRTPTGGKNDFKWIFLLVLIFTSLFVNIYFFLDNINIWLPFLLLWVLYSLYAFKRYKNPPYIMFTKEYLEFKELPFSKPHKIEKDSINNVYLDGKLLKFSYGEKNEYKAFSIALLDIVDKTELEQLINNYTNQSKFKF